MAREFRSVRPLVEAAQNPPQAASRAFQSAVYGAHPYGYDMRPETLNRIQVIVEAAGGRGRGPNRQPGPMVRLGSPGARASAHRHTAEQQRLTVLRRPLNLPGRQQRG